MTRVVYQTCLFCGGDRSEPDHGAHCDGRQGFLEVEASPDFDGETYEHERDHARLHAQLSRVYRAMRGGTWHTLSDLETLTGDPQASVSARLRDLRKEKFGGHHVERRYLHDGLWEYRLDEALVP